MSPRKIKWTSGAMLLIGFSAALAVYVHARPSVDDLLTGNPLSSKSYVHQLGVIGGKQSVAMAGLVEWFESLWQGETLAGTLAVMTLLATLAFRFVAFRPDLYAPFDEPVRKSPVPPLKP